MKSRTVQTPGVCLGLFGLADDLEKKKKELKLDIQKTFQVLVLFGFNHSSNSNQVKGWLMVKPKASFWSFEKEKK